MDNRGNYKIIDAHCDTLSELADRGGSFENNGLCISLDKLRAYGGYVQFFAAWLDDAERAPLQRVLLLIDRFNTELSKCSGTMLQVLSAEDFGKAFLEKKVGAMLTVENGKCLEGSLSNLRILYRLGVRAMTLTWNGANELGDGVMEHSGGGLTEFGRSVVAEMNHLGMMIDVSHISEKGFWEVLSLSGAPVMASHSNAHRVAGHQRNLTDEQIRALAGKGGVIGLNVYPAFLSDAGRAGLEDCLGHIEHILAVGGEDCLGLGSDFDGFAPPMTENLAGPEGYINLFLLLEQKGFSPRLIDKISHGNFLRFAKRILH